MSDSTAEPSRLRKIPDALACSGCRRDFAGPVKHCPYCGALQKIRDIPASADGKVVSLHKPGDTIPSHGTVPAVPVTETNNTGAIPAVPAADSGALKNTKKTKIAPSAQKTDGKTAEKTNSGESVPAQPLPDKPQPAPALPPKSTATPAPTPAPVADKKPKASGKIYWIGGILLVFWLLSRIGSGDKPAPVAPQPVAATPAVVTMYALRDAAVRSMPSAGGNRPVVVAPRGTSFSGTWVPNMYSPDRWLKITSGAYSGDYVFGKSLSEDYIAPPQPASAPGEQAPTEQQPADAAAADTPPADSPSASASSSGETAAAAGSTEPSPGVPSFNCRFARRWSEVQVCRTPSLIPLDRQMANNFRSVFNAASPSQRMPLISSQRQWLMRREQCRLAITPAMCLTDLYNSRISELASRLPAAASAEAPAPAPVPTTPDTSAGIITGTPRVIDSATFDINGQRIRLWGIQGVSGIEARSVHEFIAARGGTISCKPMSYQYLCTTGTGTDLNAAILRGGAGRTAGDATEEYKGYEFQARQAKKGIWTFSKF